MAEQASLKRAVVGSSPTWDANEGKMPFKNKADKKKWEAKRFQERKQEHIEKQRLRRQALRELHWRERSV